jgi:hypothetical protein
MGWLQAEPAHRVAKIKVKKDEERMVSMHKFERKSLTAFLLQGNPIQTLWLKQQIHNILVPCPHIFLSTSNLYTTPLLRRSRV